MPVPGAGLGQQGRLPLPPSGPAAPAQGSAEQPCLLQPCPSLGRKSPEGLEWDVTRLPGSQKQVCVQLLMAESLPLGHVPLSGEDVGLGLANGGISGMWQVGERDVRSGSRLPSLGRAPAQAWSRVGPGGLHGAPERCTVAQSKTAPPAVRAAAGWLCLWAPVLAPVLATGDRRPATAKHRGQTWQGQCRGNSEMPESGPLLPGPGLGMGLGQGGRGQVKIWPPGTGVVGVILGLTGALLELSLSLHRPRRRSAWPGLCLGLVIILK